MGGRSSRILKAECLVLRPGGGAHRLWDLGRLLAHLPTLLGVAERWMGAVAEWVLLGVTWDPGMLRWLEGSGPRGAGVLGGALPGQWGVAES